MLELLHIAYSKRHHYNYARRAYYNAENGKHRPHFAPPQIRRRHFDNIN